MAVTLQADPTQAGFNAYCDRAHANEYLIERRLWASAWDNCANKEAALMQATRELDRLQYLGSLVDTSQRHAWPRSGLADVAETELPEALKDACAELAFYLAAQDQTQPQAAEVFEELKVDVITIKYREPGTGRELTSEMPDSVTGLLGRYLVGGNLGTVNRRAVR
jgi:hypothetical protein